MLLVLVLEGTPLVLRGMDASDRFGVCAASVGGERVVLVFGVAMLARDSGGVGMWLLIWSAGMLMVVGGGGGAAAVVVVVLKLASSGAPSPKSGGGKYEKRRPLESVVAGFAKMEFERNVGCGGGKLGSNVYVFIASGGESKT